MISSFILCAGHNSRIQKYKKKIIKPLIIYKNKTLLEHHLSKLNHLNNLLKNKDIYINTNKKTFESFKFIKKKFKINLIIEKNLLGTAGAVISELKNLNDDILILYGDNYLHIDLKKFINFYYKKKCDMLVGVFKKKDLSQSGRIFFDPRSKITNIEEKISKNKNLSGYCNAGIYLLKKKILRVFKKNIFLDFSFHIFPKVIKKRKVYVYKIGYCKAFDDEKSYKKNILEIKSKK